MTIELKDIEARLENGEVPPTKRICDAIAMIGGAKKLGGEIAYLTPIEVRFLSVAGDLAYVVQELVRIMDDPSEQLKCSEPKILPLAREALKAIHGWQTWRCPKCGTVETVSSCYHGKYCMKCDGYPMEVWGNKLAASSRHGASSTPEAPAPPPAPAPNLDYVLRQFRDLSQAMIGMCDCEKPDKEARGKALTAWVEMRDKLVIALLP